MVLKAVVLVTVSALAIHSHYAAETFEVHHACEGETFCPIKPDNYPQEKIDQLVLKHLSHLHRMKRDVPTPQPAIASPDETGNCGVIEVQKVKPFTYNKENSTLPTLVVQSVWFEQTVPQVMCSNVGATCFQSFHLGISGVNFTCATKMMSAQLMVYNITTHTIQNEKTNIDIDCVCVVKYQTNSSTSSTQPTI